MVNGDEAWNMEYRLHTGVWTNGKPPISQQHSPKRLWTTNTQYDCRSSLIKMSLKSMHSTREKFLLGQLRKVDMWLPVGNQSLCRTMKELLICACFHGSELHHTLAIEGQSLDKAKICRSTLSLAQCFRAEIMPNETEIPFFLFTLLGLRLRQSGVCNDIKLVHVRHDVKLAGVHKDLKLSAVPSDMESAEVRNISKPAEIHDDTKLPMDQTLPRLVGDHDVIKLHYLWVRIFSRDRMTLNRPNKNWPLLRPTKTVNKKLAVSCQSLILLLNSFRNSTVAGAQVN